MQQELPLALQVALYASAGAILVSAVVVIFAMFQLRRKFERLVESVEEFKAELVPLTQEARVVVKRLGDLSGRAQRQWSDVEIIVANARRWSGRADVLVSEIGAIVEPPIAVAAYGARRLRGALNALVGLVLNRNRFQQTKVRES